jgi:hypothetical protein
MRGLVKVCALTNTVVHLQDRLHHGHHNLRDGWQLLVDYQLGGTDRMLTVITAYRFHK